MSDIIPYTGGDGGNSLLPTSVSRRFEYLRGKQDLIGGAVQWIFFGIVAFIVYLKIDQISHFFDSLVTVALQALFLGAVGVVGALAYVILKNPRFRSWISMMVDTAIFAVHRRWVSRNKFGAAQFSIRRLVKRKKEADEAAGRVEGAKINVDTAAEKAKAASNEALNNAKGLDAAMAKVRAFKAEDPNYAVPRGQPTMEQMTTALRLAKTRLRSNYEFYLKQAKQSEVLGKRCEMLRFAGEATQAQIDKMELDLDLAQQAWQLAVDSNAALQASDDLVDSEAKQTYDMALGMIVDETNAFEGRIQMLMNRLEPTIQKHNMDKVMDSINDEEFYKQWLDESNVNIDNPVLEAKLLEAPKAPVDSDIESFLGIKKAEPVMAAAPRKNSVSNAVVPKKFDKFFD